MKKLFTGIEALMVRAPQPGIGGNEHWLVVGIMDALNEEVPFIRPVAVRGAVEDWLKQIEAEMKVTLKKSLQSTLLTIANPKRKRENWIKQSIGQLLILSGQVSWTMECETSLTNLSENKTSLKKLKKSWKKYLDRCSMMIREDLPKVNLNGPGKCAFFILKLATLITIEVHARDVIDRLIKSNKCDDKNAFEWISQLRFEYHKEENNYGTVYALQTNSMFPYGYEYQGNTGRLVMTPSVDRCYLTLTTALHLHLGASAQGPAGTGKTETIKDLGKALGKHVVIFSCSNKLNQMALTGWLGGLAQSGSWGFLNMVTLQIQTLFRHLAARSQHFNFEGREIVLNPQFGVFTTMNSGYIGRTELPDNLQVSVFLCFVFENILTHSSMALFRPVAMIIPDSQMIVEVSLQADGFTESKVLSQKICKLYDLMAQQLSKQQHYDFNLRAIMSALKRASQIARTNKEMTEEMVIFRALKDVNMCKLVGSDAALFRGLLQDIFINAEQTEAWITKVNLQSVVEKEMQNCGLQADKILVSKILQLYESLSTRQGNILVGATNTGKTCTWKTLVKVLNTMQECKNGSYYGVQYIALNPKAVTIEQLYGFFDASTKEWRDGVLSTTLRKTTESTNLKVWKWVILDGPVDTLWAENLNSMLDDNRVLTLINGDRISLPEETFLIFETQDLAMASPSTVSRLGIIYLENNNSAWKLYLESWKQSASNQQMLGPAGVEYLQQLFDTHVNPLLQFKKQNCREISAISDFNAVQSLCQMLSCVLTTENGVDKNDEAYFMKMIEHWFVFCLVWTIGGMVVEEDRAQIDLFIRRTEVMLPPLNTVYDYFVDPSKKEWGFWQSKVLDEWKPLPNTPFHRILVPTTNTLRSTYIIIYSQTVQDILDHRLIKHHGDIFVPTGGRERLVVFIDDLNMPQKDQFGYQPPLEFIRQWLQYGFWFDLTKQTPKKIQGMQMLSAMGLSNGISSVIPDRLQSKCSMLNFTFPSDEQIQRIYGTILNDKFTRENFDSGVKAWTDQICNSTIYLFKKITSTFLPTPKKCHYVFSLKDISKMFQGLLQAHRSFCDTKESLLKIWCHESMRVFYDRLVTPKDQQQLVQWLEECLRKNFDCDWNALFANSSNKYPLFTSFHDAKKMKEEQKNEKFVEEKEKEEQSTTDLCPYQEVVDRAILRELVQQKLQEYNVINHKNPMNLVLFEEAITHLCHIHRLITQPRGHAILVGEKGSGRQSLTRLAAYISGYYYREITLKKNYSKRQFYDEVQELYLKTGKEQQPAVLLIADTQFIEESFLEDINNMLSTGQIPTLFSNNELQSILDSLRVDAKREGYNDTYDSLYSYFIEQVRQHLRIVLCVNPIGSFFLNNVKVYPSLISCASVKWFMEWPEPAFKEVSQQSLNDVELRKLPKNTSKEQIVNSITQVFYEIHVSVKQMAAKMAKETKYQTYVVPPFFLALLTSYKELLKEKQDQIQISVNKLTNGLFKIEEAKKHIAEMTADLEKMKDVVFTKQTQCEKLLVQIIQQQREADEKKIKCELEKAKTAEEARICEEIEISAQADLEKALPALQEAVEALNKLISTVIIFLLCVKYKIVFQKKD
ncbi:hypothetical protein RFI_32529 [Reticulomyxa filosa]|uniref:Dynein heavy chain n=1 Tax=Reticulomyxa filosa TaxID=46433 RepID=X6LTD4_RETFI|nr:hypothetical protein RFI_32529 [Reticulomyxa filosa]|eukprot:ETO04869.1 hypothetical protein RFI_32529 [Reticulomyxa filosa]